MIAGQAICIKYARMESSIWVGCSRCLKHLNVINKIELLEEMCYVYMLCLVKIHKTKRETCATDDSYLIGRYNPYMLSCNSIHSSIL